MHRSGTSALTRTLSLLGASLPKRVIGAGKGNESGHWEPEKLVNLHDEMLAEVGSRWDDWRPFNQAALSSERLEYYKLQIREIVLQEYTDAELFVLKDPRICRFAPLYEQVLTDLGIVPKYVLFYRNPLSVLSSLETRDEISASYAGLVWLRHALDAEFYSRGKERIVLSYEDFLNDWLAAVQKISSGLRIDWPMTPEGAREKIEAHLSRGLQHHVAKPADIDRDARISPEIRTAYSGLLELDQNANDSIVLKTFDEVRTRFDEGATAYIDAMFGEMAIRQRREILNTQHLQRLAENHEKDAQKVPDLLRRLNDWMLDKEAITTQLATVEKELDDGRKTISAQADKVAGAVALSSAMETELQALRNSTSWKLTAPLRLASNLLGMPKGMLITKVFQRVLQVQPGSPTFVQPRQLIKKITRRALSNATSGTHTARAFPLSSQDEVYIKASFDQEFYLAQRPDIANSGLEPLHHYLTIGWKEGLDPSPAFCTRYYLDQSPDLVASGSHPFLHWVFHGKSEGRRALPFSMRSRLIEYAPKVSVVIPNFNHGRFLEQRIESIINQTYSNFEVLILDDSSTDDSREIIDRYCQKYPSVIQKLFNTTNSGNVFKQWRKGFEHTNGELIWICESDDFCEPNFLESMVQHFKDRSVSLAFGRIEFCNHDGTHLPGMDQFREGAEAGIWRRSITRPAKEWFAHGLGVNNVIANVGGCVWRRHALSDQIWRQAEHFQVLGDWFLYMHIAGGGQIAYNPEAIAYFRQHSDNTSVAAFKKSSFYKEHEQFMLLLRQQWDVPDQTVDRFYDNVAALYSYHNLLVEFGPLAQYCDKQKLLSERQKRKHILMAFLGFHVGGGEVFPIHLANALHDHGHLVSMLALDMRNVNQEMFDSVSTGIPVYDSSYVSEIGADRFLFEAGISLIHSHMIALEAFFFEEANIKTDLPYLVSLHGSYESSVWTNDRLWRFARGVKHWVYTTDRNLQPLRSLPLSEKIFTKLPNAMPNDPRPFPKTREELGLGSETLVFTLVARGIQRKGWRAAIAAFQRLRDAHKDRSVHLLLCGDGEEKERHESMFRNDSDITFLGYQSRIHGLYRMSDVAMVPTRFGGESFPLCIIQALQTETPIIATRTGEIESMIAPDGYESGGILIEPLRNTDIFIQRLQEAMEKMLDDKYRKEVAKAAGKLGNNYAMEKIVGSYSDLYEAMT